MPAAFIQRSNEGEGAYLVVAMKTPSQSAAGGLAS
jgi:hypothetical protein